MGCTESAEASAEQGTQLADARGGAPDAPKPLATPAREAQKRGSQSANDKKPAEKPSEEMSKRGTKLLDKYVLGKVLGQGAFGVVYKCRKKGSNQDFAVKMVDQVETPLPEIEREVDMLQVLKHPSIIKLHDVFYEKVFVCMVLELYKGGDMIQGMMAHWKKKGMIPMQAVRYLTKQMWEATAFLHARGYVHRDVKGDNFMMDQQEVESPTNRIFLSDFGTVVEIKPGERITSKCGTKNYWSPEFYKQSYGQKVDCWAVGVIMFGFFSGKFPFKNEDEVKHKKLQIHSRVGEEGEQLLKMAFARDENKRCEASEAARHPFISSQNNPSFKQFEADPNDNTPLEGDLMQEPKPNGGVVDRRRELVRRIVLKATQKEKETKAAESPKVGRQASIVSSSLKNPVTVQQLGDQSFNVFFKETERSSTFQWTNVNEAKALLGVMKDAKSQKGVVNEDTSKKGIHQQLKSHDIKLSMFGKDQAKPLEEFVEEIQQGKARLLIDATRPKFLVRTVDTICLRIFVKTPGGNARKYLVETKETYPDGRVRELFQLPGHKKAPHENIMQGAERLVREMLHMKDCGIIFEFSNVDRQEDRVSSPSYPVESVYVKTTVTGVMTVSDPKVLQRVGFSGKGAEEFEVDDQVGYFRNFRWMSEAECKGKGISLRPKQFEDEISALVPPPLGLDEEALTDYLLESNVDLSVWGTGAAKSVADFSDELVKGECALAKKDDGKIVRTVDIVVLKVLKETAEGTFVLREIEEGAAGKVNTLDRLPATKRRADEHPFAAARRMVSQFLIMDDNTVSIDPDDVKILQEEQQSSSYPGITSVYRKRFMTATLRAATDGAAAA